MTITDEPVGVYVAHCTVWMRLTGPAPAHSMPLYLVADDTVTADPGNDRPLVGVSVRAGFSDPIAWTQRDESGALLIAMRVGVQP